VSISPKASTPVSRQQLERLAAIARRILARVKQESGQGR